MRSWEVPEASGVREVHDLLENKLHSTRAAHALLVDTPSAPQAAPDAFKVLNDSDDLHRDAELVLLLPPREYLHTLLSAFARYPIRAS